MAARKNIRDRIVDTALKIADEKGWGRVRLHDIADRLDIGLEDIHKQFGELDEIGDAWFARADTAMLKIGGKAGKLPAAERLHRAIVCWLDVLAPHRRVARDILTYKLRWPHVHLTAALVVRLSQTVQWLREAAALDATGRQKQIEETGLSMLFASTVAYWLYDGSADQRRTREFLRRGLARSDRLMARLWRKSAA
ncbi:MAG: hypothetical protein QF654_15270 [Alphaproteobacteria bacterium]|jgi:AcrR family transcriptional regulator|nr:hypothetical protein [Alphaproteobacteria bacterium]